MKKKPAPRGLVTSSFQSFCSSWTVRTTALVWVVTMPFFSDFADAAAPTATTKVGDTVTNPVTGLDTTVNELVLDPDAAPGAPALAFVKTSDNYVILVRNKVNDVIYNNDSPPLAFVITAVNNTTKEVTLRLQSDPAAPTGQLSYAPTLTKYNQEFSSNGSAGDITPPIISNGADGVRNVQVGQGGSNGRDGALVVPPTSGGDGATGPTVTVTNSQNITATNKYGIEAGSIGGNGGSGGDSYLSVWGGRDGGNGGAGGTVNVTNNSGFQVNTSGDGNHGIFGYSRSGAAGSGGGGFAAPGGGTGGHSSNGGAVTITNNGDVITSGNNAFGIFGLSVSGNGGNGGSQWGLVGQSGSGGYGGSGGSISITNTGTIQTSGNFSHGIVGQSIGGTGGSSGTSGNLLVSLIGSTDNGGNGGTVTITNSGGITTTGNDSAGIFAQSTGGGGGLGGSAGGLVAIGGAGSNGGSGAAVSVTNSATGIINTSGLRSDGIFAQSIGGSGGGSLSGGGLVAIGGTGAKGGDGGTVTVTNYGTISTTKNSSRGILAQSIGGAGGDGGSVGGMVSVGGSGAGGGSSSTVTVTNGGNITTLGNDAWGILAQSVGGGGGNGGSSGSVGAFVGVSVGGKGNTGGAGGAVNVTLQGKDANTASLISTTGDRSVGLFAQSIGGGGGNGGGAVQATVGAGAAVSIAVGGSGGSGGAGGNVTLLKGTGLSVIQTQGDDSAGAMIQSVGKGGGNGGYSVAAAASGGVAAGSLSVSVGGDGGGGGIGGTVNVGTFDANNLMLSTGYNGSILTSGERSTGFLAQSVGGGGGNGGLSVAASASGGLLGSASIGVGIGGKGAGGGAGGTVNVGYQGNITTEKSNSTGLLAQSVGGGGGNGGGSIAGTISDSSGVAGAISVGIGGAGGTASAGGNVSVATRSGTITTKGDNSTGIIVQSVGGGGGNGGYSVAAGIGTGGVGAGSINVGLGGTAGGGGNGGSVRADLQSNVTTSSVLIPASIDPATGKTIPAHFGLNSGAILVQSVGGGGGNGGFNVSAGLALGGGGSGAVSVGLGGAGGAGGTGGTVNASSTGTLWTQGGSSSAFIAQSIGGGGGAGGYNIAAGLAGAGAASGAVGVGLGGKGGSGNHAGIVTAATSVGSITTVGNDSFGVLAQSVGGGGGAGGFNVSGIGSGAGGAAGAVAVGLGGSGGAGGIGNTVTLTVNNDVTTFGKNSSAVIAQSIGGGGGAGGFNVSGALAAAGMGSGSLAVGLGGNGAGGGNGGVVNSTVNGNIATTLDSSIGILAQSVGGGGGNGGFNVSGTLAGAGQGSGAVSIGLGGKGGVAGNGGEDNVDRAVTLTTTGTVVTKGSNSSGVVAQSIGGGGGNGGFNVSAGLSGGGGVNGALSVGLGGGGGTGGVGKDVYARIASDVTTSGEILAGYTDPITGEVIPVHYGFDSIGVLFQSVGGGGGAGGFNVSGTLSGGGIGAGGISVGLGGNGGTGGLGGNVDSASSGQIVTHGNRSSGFVSQSIGGGGGVGGYNVSGSLAGAGVGIAVNVGLGGHGGSGNNAGTVLALSSGNVWTYGNQATGVLAQSVGGGGGAGGFNVSGGAAFGSGAGGVSVGLGGDGGAAGDGKKVDLTVHNTVFTDGNQSAGIVAQSLGGGGGVGGYNVSAIGGGGGSGAGTVGVGLGGNGAGGGNGGIVVLSTTGAVETHGKQSTGILAQSVGGGGGSGGFNVTVSGSGAGNGSLAVGVGLGGSGSGGGNADTVDLTVRNTVKTTGKDSSGIIAQSVGGGGGNGGFDVTVAGSGAGQGSGALGVSLGGSAGTGGFAQTVTSDVIGNIQTSGNNSLGFLSQSVGGGGGNGGFSVSAAISGAGKGSGAVAIGLGGSGGDGGHGGQVISSYSGDIRTAGDNSTAVVSQSLGGGGGTGGFSVAGTFSAAKNGSLAVSVGIGGSGGGGSYADTVNNTVTGTIVTSQSLLPASTDPVTGEAIPAHYGKNSGGVLAQSVGGGGGSGGFNVSGSISLAQGGSGAASVGIGGSGGDGGYAQKVTNLVTGDVFTSGAGSFGIAAQSVGGGGGNGAFNVSGTIAAAKDGSGALGIGIGGSGGGGGAAGDVDNRVTGYVQTQGNDATGILAQSLGGGGGFGAMNITGVITGSKSGSGNVGFGMGGFGGDGGAGKVVYNQVTGGVVTMGNGSQGIVAQSLGGGGGNGGMNVTGTINISKESGGNLGIGIGGFGGKGGSASDVTSIIKTTATNNQIATAGDDSSAVVAQSIGGGGGNGALNVTGAISLTGKDGAAIGVGVGGFGGGSGNAGIVTADVTGDIVTRGQNSNGILAQSIGGAGGNGGTNVTGTLAFSNSSGGPADSTAVSLGVGGFGGGGGKAGAVDVKYNGTISAVPGVYHPPTTDPVTGAVIPGSFEIETGVGSHGLAAQSIGGGGGMGGLNVSAGISFARGQGDGDSLFIGVGGYGGKGGDADKVDVTVTGGNSITAYGAGKSALLAQSIGGGGGDGATNVSGGIVASTPLILGVGGSGGSAGVGKDVTVTAATDLFTSGDSTKIFSSAGLMAQSLGGGGGNGGLNVSGGLALSKAKDDPSITIGIGGKGGAGAISGDVTVDHTGNIVTTGNWVHGLMAQSIAGGGGNGGFNSTTEFNFADSENSGGKTDMSAVVGVGGNAGKGADAGDVFVTQNGIVSTAGSNARGVAAQSIGGGGGTGGMNVSGIFATKSSPIQVGVGGSGGGGGHAGMVTVNRGTALSSTGKITTNGESSYGIEASSIGGGGGDAGMNFNIGITLANRKETDSGFAANIAIGGDGGEAGNGAAAKVNNYSDIETKQDSSHGIMAQSIGGGGGNGNFNVAVTYAGSENTAKEKKNLGFNLAIGGQPGDGGHGDNVDVVQVGDIETHGLDSYGILAQSIGGGGGNVGLDFATTLLTGGGTVAINMGRYGGTGGWAGNVTARLDGNILTHNDGSFGILAQSIGNGGGNSASRYVSVTGADTKDKPADAVAVGIGLEGGEGGYAGTVLIHANGSVETFGNNAHAIFAQSVGGGGGNGGSANALAAGAPTASLAVGGQGGKGGTGGAVDVISSALVKTHGTDSVGILAQSVGGGGGNGGAARSGGASKVDGINVTVGGGGGTGMSSGKVTVENSGIVITDGESSHGVLAQSLGGGGGNAGMTLTTIMKNVQKGTSNRAQINVGGKGGEGGFGGEVVVTNTGGIGTSKANSIGIFAQSIGGGGGNANSIWAMSASGDGGGNNVSLNVGGDGGKGASGGNVTVYNKKTADPDSGKIITVGNYSHGILAMSVGGGGGVGSTVVSALRETGTPAKNTATNGFVMSLGGDGGEGGTGGIVKVENEGTITTYGYKAHGILAQSIGGGGGNGGVAFAGDMVLGKSPESTDGKMGVFSLGGDGGNGNTGGDVTVKNTGIIETFGVRAAGIYAQSVGGGGGDGGFASTLSRNMIGNPTTKLSKSVQAIGLGGFGGDGANSGNVLVTNNGSIISHGANSFGIFAQSVGGGGGNAAHEVTSPAWMAADLAYETLLGGRGGDAGAAGTVTINTTGNITMLGANSTAQFSQSVNGGGGNIDLFLDVSKHAVAIGDDGVELPDNGGDVDKTFAFLHKVYDFGAQQMHNAASSVIDATHIGDLHTFGKDSIASLFQTVGGGGGNATTEVVVDTNATVDLELALGAKDSSDNKGGDVTIKRDGDVGTTGDHSQGAGVQSIGGGGGNLTVNIRKVPAPPATTPLVAPAALRSTLAIAPLAPPVPGATADVLLGAAAGLTSNGGNITLDYTGDVATTGDYSPGLVVQSIGGGGGKVDLTGLDSLTLALGGKLASSGNGGDIQLTNVGGFFTQGKFSNGLMLQSIGGGGGYAFTNMDAANINLSLNSDNSGNGGKITFDQTGDMVVMGEGSIALLAQSLGGGGGVVDRMFMDTAGGAGTSGDVKLTLNGNILAEGKDGIAVFAQSRAADGQGNIEIELKKDKMMHAGVNGEALHISGGADNHFTNRGVIATADGLNGKTTMGEEGNDAIDNFGTFFGQFDLGDGTNRFINKTGAKFIPGPQLKLGDASNLLTNEGVMTPGDMLYAQHTDMTGSFVQTAGGKTLAELDFGPETIDQIFMTGAAKLNGEMNVSLLNPQLVKSGHFQKTLFHGDEGVTDDGMFLTTAPSVVINYDILYPTGYDAVLDYTVDFSPQEGGGLGVNLREVGNYFNHVQNAGNSPSLADTVITLLYAPDMETYKFLLSQMDPSFYGEAQAEMYRSAERFGDLLADGGEMRCFEHDKFVWFNFGTDSTTHDAFDDFKEVVHNSDSAAFGVQQMLKSQWILGGGLSFEHNDSAGYDGRWTSSGESFHLGAIAKKNFNGTEVSGSIAYGSNQTDYKRLGGVAESFEAESSRDLQTFTAMARVSHVFDMQECYLRPSFDLGITRLEAGDTHESGAGGISLDLKDYEEIRSWIRPTIAMGTCRELGSELKLHLHAEVGAQYYLTEDQTHVKAGLTGAPSGVDPMNVPIELGSNVHASVGVDLIHADKGSIGIEYSKILDQNYSIDHWGVRANFPF